VQQVRRLAGAWVAHGRVMGVPVSKDKVMRAQAIAGQAQAGQLYADRKAPWWPAFAAELSSFPLGSPDDQVDACAGVLSLALEHLKTRQTLELLLATPVTVRQRAELTGGWRG
jgi:predicted phage terminase large subunit-like protein